MVSPRKRARIPRYGLRQRRILRNVPLGTLVPTTEGSRMSERMGPPRPPPMPPPPPKPPPGRIIGSPLPRRGGHPPGPSHGSSGRRPHHAGQRLGCCGRGTSPGLRGRRLQRRGEPLAGPDRDLLGQSGGRGDLPRDLVEPAPSPAERPAIEDERAGPHRGGEACQLLWLGREVPAVVRDHHVDEPQVAVSRGPQQGRPATSAGDHARHPSSRPSAASWSGAGGRHGRSTLPSSDIHFTEACVA